MHSETQDDASGSIGSSIDRVEDPRLVTGGGRYIDDHDRPSLTHMAVVRSPYAHARLEAIDTSEAEAIEGVLGVYTSQHLEAAGVPGDIPCIYRVPDLREPPHRVLARERVRYQGKPVAVVVAEDRYTAATARDAVDVSYERLEAVTDPREALTSAAPTIHEEAPDNVCFQWEVGDQAATEKAFDGADHVFEFEWDQPRIVPNALDPRGALADFDAVTEKLTISIPSQNPFTHQEVMAAVLDHPKRKIRVVAPEVGGGFGTKSMFYPGETLTAFCSMQLERPVKWVETRTEAFVADEHGRGQTIEAAMAVDNDGAIQGVRIETIAGLGGDLSTKGAVGPTTTFGPLTSGQYAIPAMHFTSRGVFTNATPTAPYRGVGRAEAAFTIERLVTLSARRLGIDPAVIRRKNFVDSESFPYETAVGSTYDSGQYEAALDEALQLIDYEELRERLARLADDGRYLGVGFSSFIEPGGFAPSKVSELLGMGLPDSTVKTSFWETADVQVHETGEVTAYCGTASHGQGSETTHAQVVADTLGVPFEQVEVIEGKDTQRGPPGSGTFGSRAAVMGGSALVQSAEVIIEKSQSIAAHHLEVTEDDIEFELGNFHVRGAPDRAMTLREVAEEAYLANDLPEGMEPGLEATSFFDPPDLTWSFGTHVAVVEVDPSTGEIDLLRYVAIDDCGVQINPEIVTGQIHGGVAAGISAALYEQVGYDDQGQLMTSSFQDYALVRAHHLPELEVEETVTPSPLNPLGAKGVGESGTVAAPPAIVNAVTDALSPFGIEHIDIPLTPERVWDAIEAAGATHR